MAGFAHIGMGLAAKPAAPRINIWVLLAASEAIDILWGFFFLLGLESMEFAPWSHSLFMSTVWSLALGALAARLYRSRRSGLVIGLVVFSHWVLDFITHPMGVGNTVRDLPLFFEGSPMLGLGLYTTHAGMWAAEIGLPLIGLAIYLHSKDVFTRLRSNLRRTTARKEA